jgi:hypothetical protein
MLTFPCLLDTPPWWSALLESHAQETTNLDFHRAVITFKNGR